VNMGWTVDNMLSRHHSRQLRHATGAGCRDRKESGKCGPRSLAAIGTMPSDQPSSLLADESVHFHFLQQGAHDSGCTPSSKLVRYPGGVTADDMNGPLHRGGFDAWMCRLPLRTEAEK